MGQIRNIPELISGPLRAEIKEIAKEAFREVLESINRNGIQGKKPSETAKPYVSAKEAGKLSGLGESTIRLYIRKRELKAHKVGSRVIIKKTDLEGFLESHPIEILSD